MDINKSACPYDCPDCCGLLITTENGRAIKVEGDPAHPFTRGTLCPKMAHYERTVHSPKRLLTPLKRVGAKGAGKFVPISWQEAVDEIASRWRGIIDRYGAEAILPYSYAGTMGTIQYSAGHALFYALGASSLDRTICAPAKADGYRSLMGGTLPTAPQEAQQSDYIVLWSISMLATDIHFKHDVDIARKNGAKIICVDTYETKTAQYADEFICVKPGSDGALALGVLHVLAREKLVDEAFIHQYVQGWEELQAQILPQYPPEKAAEITGLSVQVIESFARAFAAARAPFIRLGSGQSRYGNGAMTSRLITCLPAVVGAYAKAGGGLLTSSSGSHAFDKDIIRRPDMEKKGVRHINMIKLGDVLTDSTLQPPVKSLFVYSSNPACTAPDQNKVLAGLKRDDLFTVVHERFMTDTALYADIVLPATTSLEHEDIYYSYGQYVIQRGKQLIPSVGESRSNWQVMQLLAEAMGLDDEFFRQSETELVERFIASTDKSWPLPVDKESLAQGEPVELPLPENYKLDFKTPSGKIEILNPSLDRQLPDYLPPHLAKDKEEFILINSPDPRILDSSFNEREELTKGNIMVLLLNPADGQRLHLQDGDAVMAENTQGQAEFTVKLSARVQTGTVVSEGVWWRQHTAAGNTNLLTHQRTTDKAEGSTFYDVRVNLRKKVQ
ncbi:putative formate dehydrogenase alpha subunit [Selenomonas ruminantium subsp. lactilytica TAM6421]|uniref:Putative formate dehydrogenase alpha subunit n=1 Tax=Selenomonas ruminantium subsp. lactilytica (strain NBRC 103574 / TAM6421) TaxID=927704 RepID=I0GRL0_SELRL|nr:molybdopterin-dependent oxidoreductase [Selenomonas ruminantium]BAL83397.1 putative formate dehydrogenase alpha subunit [Selenomonas ruminantium subsp. lactilytica TAM6421]